MSFLLLYVGHFPNISKQMNKSVFAEKLLCLEIGLGVTINSLSRVKSN